MAIWLSMSVYVCLSSVVIVTTACLSGETALNYNKTFTGWIDTDLSETGVKEIEHAAALLIEKGRLANLAD